MGDTRGYSWEAEIEYILGMEVRQVKKEQEGSGVYEDDMEGETMGDRCLELGDMLFRDSMET